MRIERVRISDFRNLKIILYGSYANATHREGSDIDIVVIA